MVASKRKVNKPRLTLRKDRAENLSGLHESIITLCFAARYDIPDFTCLPPKEIMEIFASVTSYNGVTKLSPTARKFLKHYIKHHKIKDWTNESGTRKTTSRVA